jgi:hypothetical protein
MAIGNEASRKQRTNSIQSVTKMSQNDEQINNLKGNGHALFQHMIPTLDRMKNSVENFRTDNNPKKNEQL